MGHEFERAAHGSAVRGTAKANARRFRRDSLRRKCVARHDADAGRTHVADKSGARPWLRERHPQVKTDRIGANAARRQDLAQDRICEPLALHRFPPYCRKQRFAGAVDDPAGGERDGIGDAMTVAVRTAEANSHPERTSGATT